MLAILEGFPLAIAVGIFFGFCASILAGRFGRRSGLWFCLGFIFPPSIIILLCLGSMPQGMGHGELEKRKEVIYTTKCPFCAEKILAEAKVCKHCGRDV